MVFDRTLGTLVSLVWDGTELIRTAPEPNFWRAPTDNDFGNGMPRRLRVWRTAGPDRHLVRIAARQDGRSRVTVETEELLPAGGARLFTTWAVYGSGDVVMRQRFVPGDTLIAELPRLGLRFTMPAGFDSVTWFGRGPQETYWDRKTGAAVGLYRAAAADLYHPYERPAGDGDARRRAVDGGAERGGDGPAGGGSAAARGERAERAPGGPGRRAGQGEPARLHGARASRSRRCGWTGTRWAWAATTAGAR